MNSSKPEDSTGMKKAFIGEEMERTSGVCPSDEQLWASAANDLDFATNEEILFHLADCAQCSTVWKLAREILPSGHVSGSTVVAIEDRLRTKRLRRSLIQAAAAIVVVGVGIGAAFFLRTDTTAPPIYRQQLEAMQIVPSLEADVLPRSACLLRWTAGPQETRYDLVVTDDSLEVLVTVKGLEKPEFLLPQEIISSSTKEILWRVTAHLPDRRTFSSETISTTIENSGPPPN